MSLPLLRTTALLLLASVFGAAGAEAQLARYLDEQHVGRAGVFASCSDGVQPSGALQRICLPNVLPWNGELVLWAHGYVEPEAPLAIPEEAGFIAEGATGFGYAFATTSYRRNGLAVLEGLADLVELVDVFSALNGTPRRVLLLGASQGGLITVLALEQRPELFAGGVALCGPYGDFAGQIDYFGDFRVVFDVYYPGLLPPSAVDVPPSLVAEWPTLSETVVRPALQDSARVAALEQLFGVTRVPWDPPRPETRVEAALQLLWYNVVSTADGRAQLGGQPFDNLTRNYFGSRDDAALNASAARFAADPSARAAAATSYTPSGALRVPLITLHTTGDEVVPYGNVPLYEARLEAMGAGALHEHHRVERFGHCNFTPTEIFGAFGRLLERLGP